MLRRHVEQYFTDTFSLMLGINKKQGNMVIVTHHNGADDPGACRCQYAKMVFLKMIDECFRLNVFQKLVNTLI